MTLPVLIFQGRGTSCPVRKIILLILFSGSLTETLAPVCVAVLANTADALENGKWQNHNTADLVMTGVVYAVSASVPVVGWAVGLAWFAGNLIYAHYHDGKKMTEELDNK